MERKKQTETESKRLEAVEGSLGTFEAFLEKNATWLMAALGVIILVIAAWLFVQNLYFEPQEREAEQVMAQGERLFAAGQYEAALKGDSVSFDGFLAVIEEYGSTKSVRLAQVYAGLCYFKLQDYENALEYLEDATLTDDVLQYTTQGTVGDCYAQTGKTEQAIEAYLKAAKSKNILVRPVYLVKAGVAYESLGRFDKALELYQQVKEERCPKQQGIPEVDDIERYIAAATVRNGK